jgi:hypothetical protein
MVMTGLEAIWVPLVAGAVVGGGTAAAQGGNFGDIAKGAGLGAVGGAATGGLASGLGGLAGAAPASTVGNVATGVTGAQVTGPLGVDTSMPMVNQQMQLPQMNKQSLIQMYNEPIQPQQPMPEQPATTQTTSQWKPSDYINAASSAANVASQIAFRPETPTPQIAPMPAIFSGQGGDLMQQLSQLSQG